MGGEEQFLKLLFAKLLQRLEIMFEQRLVGLSRPQCRVVRRQFLHAIDQEENWT